MNSTGPSRALRAALGRIAAVRARGPAGSDRGDVPGWVLVTVMTAGLVSVLWVAADKQLSAMFSAALSAVTGS